MAEGIATRSSRGHRTICLPIEEEDYLRIIHDPKAFRRTLDDCFRQTPELFPVNFALGYELKDDRMSAKQQIPIRRILLKDDSAYSIRPSFLMPYMTARTADVEGPLFLRKFGVPFWALARVFGGDPMFWYRMECGLGRFSVVGTTVRTATLPEHLLADEHHQVLDGQKVYIAGAIRKNRCLGAGFLFSHTPADNRRFPTLPSQGERPCPSANPANGDIRRRPHSNRGIASRRSGPRSRTSSSRSKPNAAMGA